MDKELKDNKIVTEKIETEEENPEKDKTGRESGITADTSTHENNESVETASDNDESRSRTMRVETKEFMNEFTTGEKYAIKTLKFVGENPERVRKQLESRTQSDIK